MIPPEISFLAIILALALGFAVSRSAYRGLPKHIDIVFDGPPGPEFGRFIEVENAARHSIRVGEWISRDDGYWVLRINPRQIIREKA